MNPKSLKNLKKNWKKGQSGNPKGKKKMLPDELGQKAITNSRLLAIINKFLYLDIEEVKKLLRKEKGIMALERIVLKIISDATKGDDRKFEVILARCLGKVPDKLHVTDEGHKSIVDAITDETD